MCVTFPSIWLRLNLQVHLNQPEAWFWDGEKPARSQPISFRSFASVGLSTPTAFRHLYRVHCNVICTYVAHEVI